jgi:hypothetical protein
MVKSITLKERLIGGFSVGAFAFLFQSILVFFVFPRMIAYVYFSGIIGLIFLVLATYLFINNKSTKNS